jgi:hypothetical protein
MRQYRRNLKRVLAGNPKMMEAYTEGARTAQLARRKWSGVVAAAVCVGAIIGATLARLVLR